TEKSQIANVSSNNSGVTIAASRRFAPERSLTKCRTRRVIASLRASRRQGMCPARDSSLRAARGAQLTDARRMSSRDAARGAVDDGPRGARVYGEHAAAGECYPSRGSRISVRVDCRPHRRRAYTLLRIESALPPRIFCFSADGIASDSIELTALSIEPSRWG